ncbi:glutaredoxin family protein [Desulfovibrio sp. OttesenSCG-928-F07]|nr:glutaredoxin family protein [Desulfovibrio sp. OttesenSCG-928-F07]
MQERYEVPDNRITVFSLTYCPYCLKSKEYLTEKGYDFDYIEVDAMEEAERNLAVEFVKKNNPRKSFPTIVFGDTGEIVVGYEPDEIDDALEIMEDEYPEIKKTQE